MGSTNRVQIASVRETTPGVPPATPRMRLVRATSESLDYTPQFVDSDELRSDRMLGAPIEVMQAASGGLNAELSYPDDNSPASDIWRSTFFNSWTNTNSRDNDGTAASVITAVATTNTVLTALTGTAFVAKELYRFSGFTVAGNNGVFACTTGSATVPRFVGSGITNEASPAAAARVQCVGFIGDSGDINATASGLSSTTTDFTTFPALVVGKWIKIGGIGAANRFVTAANNGWARITSIAAGALGLDNLPAGWATETGTALTIKVWFGDYIVNSTAATSMTLEKGFLDQTVPTYIVNTGMQVNTNDLTIQSKSKITQAISFMGMGGSQGTVALDSSCDPVTTGLVMAGNANVGRIAENNVTLTSPNWAKSLTIKFNNNLRTIEDVTTISPVGILPGEFSVGGEIDTYFGDNSLLTKLYNGTPTSISTRITKTSASVPQALILTFPTVYLRGGGNPMATGKNADVMAKFTWSAAFNATYSCSAMLNRLSYWEA
jgi:hypothetical protein